ncbi:hypothetical protein PG996_016063 [Apiospora saccharicola]|uniref:Uncharacterized protein n=1 Tax=Apiospora saccharicola TaxID=335842 RepID=A0ABR1TMV7_9PEZI
MLRPTRWVQNVVIPHLTSLTDIQSGLPHDPTDRIDHPPAHARQKRIGQWRSAQIHCHELSGSFSDGWGEEVRLPGSHELTARGAGGKSPLVALGDRERASGRWAVREQESEEAERGEGRARKAPVRASIVGANRASLGLLASGDQGVKPPMTSNDLGGSNTTCTPYV